jgi:hypothetical protein
MLSSLLILSLAAIAPLVHATVYVTDPVATSTLPAGQPATIKWQDDGTAPSLAQFGLSSIGLYVGSPTQQTLLQSIATNVDVSKVGSQGWTPDPKVGPDSSVYFIRFTSNNFSDPKQPQFKIEAFSAKFTLTGMTGTFSPTIQAQINGSTTASGAASTAPASAAAPSAAAPGGSTTRAASPVSASTAPSAAQASSSPSSAASTKNGAGHITVPRVLTATGIAAITFIFCL